MKLQLASAMMALFLPNQHFNNVSIYGTACFACRLDQRRPCGSFANIHTNTETPNLDHGHKQNRKWGISRGHHNNGAAHTHTHTHIQTHSHTPTHAFNKITSPHTTLQPHMCTRLTATQVIGIVGKLLWVGGSMGPWVSRKSDVCLAHLHIARIRFPRQGSLQVTMSPKGLCGSQGFVAGGLTSLSG
jgi:hypothetical protein